MSEEQEDKPGDDMMELSDLLQSHAPALSSIPVVEVETDTEPISVTVNEEFKPLKAVLRRSSFSTTGGAATGNVVFSNTSTSDYATQRRLEKERHMKTESMQRQIDLLEQKNLESIKQRRKLVNDIEGKNRECKFYEKQVLELTSENQRLKAQLESTVRVSSGLVGGRDNIIGSLAGTKRGLDNNSALSHKLPHRDQSTVQELRATRDKLASVENDHKSLSLQNSELSMQIKILQDALNFRSEEIGLSGHADLLTKVAKLRGEVSALKSELLAKEDELTSLSTDKHQLFTEQKDLQSQINTIQQRLALAQQESHRLVNTDIGQLLKSTEQERDVLVEYIQSDMQKSNMLAKQVESLEAELRIQRKKTQLADEKFAERDELCKQLTAKQLTLEQENKSFSERQLRLKNSVEQLKLESESLQNQLNQKITDEEELIKVQVSLYAQVGVISLDFYSVIKLMMLFVYFNSCKQKTMIYITKMKHLLL
jgi:hypothetical protein